MPTSSAQARFKTYSAILSDEEKRRKEQERIYTRETKKVKRAGFGRFLGNFIGLMVGAGLMSSGFGRLGSEIGERSVGGTSQIDESDYLFGITGEGGIRQANFEMGERDKAFNQAQWVGMGEDVFKDFLLKGMGKKPSGIATSGGVDVVGDAVRAGSMGELLTKLASQRKKADFFDMIKKTLAQQGQQSLLEQLLQDRQKRTRKPFDFGGSPVDNFRINQ